MVRKLKEVPRSPTPTAVPVPITVAVPRTLTSPHKTPPKAPEDSPRRSASRNRPDQPLGTPLDATRADLARARSARACEFLLDSEVMGFLRWGEIGRLHGVSATSHEMCEDPAVAPGLWMAACRSLGLEASLYVPEHPPALYAGGGGNAVPAAPSPAPAATAAAAADETASVAPSDAGDAVIGGGSGSGGGAAGAEGSLPPSSGGAMAWKRFFFDGLWPARGKWHAAAQEDEAMGGEAPPPPAADFRINVCVRFRPLAEPPVDSKLGLPLHQYIKLQRQQARKKSLRDGQVHKVTVGMAPPAHFLDGVFGTLMKDPVRLPSSGVVTDRAGAAEHIKRYKKDLFDGSRLLHPNRLEELPELRAEIEAWRAEKARADEDLDRVKRSVIVRDLVDGEAGLPAEVPPPPKGGPNLARGGGGAMRLFIFIIAVVACVDLRQV